MDESIEYKDFDIECWQALSDKRWYVFISQFGFYVIEQLDNCSTCGEALESAKKQIDFIIFIESN